MHRTFTACLRVPGLGLAAAAFVVCSAWPAIAVAQAAPYSGSPAAIPGTIEAEDFDNGGEAVAYHDTTAGNAGGAYRPGDVDLEASTEGGYDVGWISAGEWLAYTVDVASAGDYTVQVRVASPAGASFRVGFDGGGTTEWSPVAIPATGGWQIWTTVSVPVTLTAGTQTLTILADTSGFNVNAITVSAGGGTGGSGTSPYGGSPVAIPGTIEAENYDNGGEGIAYHDTTLGNSGGAYRSGNVDLEASVEGGYDVGWISAGEWLTYTVDVAQAGDYTAEVRVASPSGALLRVGFDGSGATDWTQVVVPATGGWQNWTSVSVPVTLAAGTQTLTILADTSGFNVNAIVVAAGGGSGGGTGGSGSAPFNGSPAPIPGTIQAEDFDTGGEGVAYRDGTPGNSGASYRYTDVDIEPATVGGYDVGWTSGGEWLTYTVEVAAAGDYTVHLRLASPTGGGALRVGFGAPSSVEQAVTVPATGGWQSWTDVALPVTLAAGPQVLTLSFDTGGFNVESVSVVSAGFTGGGGSSDVTVVTWNLKNDPSLVHAIDTMDQVAAMSPQPEIVAIQEGFLSHFQDYIDELQARTGRTWHGVFATHCALGAWTGTSCTSSQDEGVGILTSLPMVDSSSTMLPYADIYHSARAAVRAAIDVGGVTVQVFDVHLPQGDFALERTNAIALLEDWASGYAAPQIVGGDFNGDPGEITSSTNMGGAFVDVWPLVGGYSGYTFSSPVPSRRIDYWFTDSGGAVQPNWSTVPLSTGTISDHLPVIAEFTISP